MRSILLALVFALSVSARCVGKKGNKQAAFPGTKSGAQNGGSLLTSNSTTNSDLGQSSGGSGGSSSSAASAPTSTPWFPNDGQSNGQGSSSTTGTTPTSTDSSGTGAAQTSSPGSSSNANTGSSNTGSTGSSTGSGSTSTLSTSTGGGGSGNCGHLKGVCFNGGMQASMYDKITTASGWITFQVGIPGGSASSRTSADHVPMMPFASNVAEAVNLVNGPNPPAWLLTFNEPDYSYMGWTPKMSPQEAADAIKPLLDKPGTGTKYVAPVTADPNSPWVDEFFAACKCKDFFSAYNIHQYQKEAKDVIANVQAYHAKHSDKPIWITEVAPGNAGCSVSWDQAGQFMKELFKFAKESGFVDRVFWNSGNQLTNADSNVCNSWLLDSSGNPGPLLPMFESVDCT